MAPRAPDAGDISRRTGALGLLVVAVVVAFAAIPAAGHPPAETGRFQTRTDLRPTPLTVDPAADGPVDGSIFVAPFKNDRYQLGPMILDGHGRLVWFHQVRAGWRAMNFRVQRYQGRPVLTWWEGTVDKSGYGSGEYVIADDSYHEIARFRAEDGRPGDFHEFLITPRGTALVTAYRPVRRDLSSWGGSENGTLLESYVEEIDIGSGRPLLKWRASDHVDLSESHEPVPTDPDENFDFFHVNSVDVDDDGDLLVSSRHTDTVYKIDRHSGAVLWRLGGERSDFTLGPGVQFFSQHDARRQPDGSITLFDNGNPPRRHLRSRAIDISLDTVAMTAGLEAQFLHPMGLSSKSQGDAQVLPGGGMFVGWGSQPYVTQFDRDGTLEFDAHFPDGTENYRAFRAAWTAHPSTRPAVTADAGDGEVTVRASWNGATEVEDWQVLAGTSPGTLRPVTVVDRTGFETAIAADTDRPYVAVRALDGSGHPLGRSRVVRVAR